MMIHRCDRPRINRLPFWLVTFVWGSLLLSSCNVLQPSALQSTAATPVVTQTPKPGGAKPKPTTSSRATTPTIVVDIQGQQTLARGYLTTPPELMRAAQLARQGVEPYQSAVKVELDYAATALDGEQFRAPETINIKSDIEKPTILAVGSKYVYAWAIAYNLLRETNPDQAQKYAQRAYDLLMQMPERNTQISDYEQNTRLNLSVYMENFVYGADLLADWTPPSTQTPFARSEAAQKFKAWLGSEIIRYPYNAAYTRVNNWGAWGRLTTAVIADYVGDAAPLYVQQFVKNAQGAYEVDPALSCPAGQLTGCRQVSAGTIYDQAILLHFDAVDGKSYEFSEASCDASGSKSMIRPDGGMPDELRRQYTCDTTVITDNYGAAARYSQFATEAMVSLAEVAWRRGDASLYTHIDPATGRGALYRSVQFLIRNNVKLTRGSMLEMVNRFYTYQASVEQDAAKRQEYQKLLDQDLPGILKAEQDWPVGEGFVSFGTLTHGFAAGESLKPPPTVPPR